MSFKVTIIPSNIEFNSDSQSSILDAALQAKINLPHGCKNGDCASCKCKLVSGEVVLAKSSEQALSLVEQQNGYVLLCKAHPKSDVLLDLPGFSNEFPIKTLPAKVISLSKLGSVVILKLKYPTNLIFNFHPGQYVDLIYGKDHRSYSLANSPTLDAELELHIRYRPSGSFSELVWNELKIGQILRFRGPLGHFWLQKSTLPILMVCTGTGFAPLKAILEKMQVTNNRRMVHLIWGNYTLEDFYLIELLEQFNQQLNFKFTLCITETNRQSIAQLNHSLIDNNLVTNNNFLTDENTFSGLVTEYVSEQYPQLKEYQIYACGNLEMIENLYKLSNNLNLLPSNFFSDAFTPSA